MSLYQLPLAGGDAAVYQKITGSSATAITDINATAGPVRVPRLQVNENNGGTPSLTVEVTDGTTHYYLGSGGFTWKARAVTALQSVEFTDFKVPLGFSVKVTSSDASGHFDVIGLTTAV